jgi:predicted transcriptional regulator
MLTSPFSDCGLNENEQKVLLFLAKRGSTPATLIARSLKIKRPTVYFLLENLISAEIVAKRRLKRTSYFSLNEPNQIAQNIEARARQKFESVQRASKTISQILKTTNIPKSKGYEVSTFDTTEDVFHAVEQSLIGTEYRGVWNPQVSCKEKRGKEITLRFLERIKKHQFPLYDIIVEGSLTDWYCKQIKNPLHKVKILPSSTTVFSDITIIDGSVYFTHYTRGEELAVRITDRTTYQTIKTIFDMSWARL